MSRSLTSLAYSGAKDDTTKSNLERCEVILRQANWASTWANHSSGSAGQKGGSFRATGTAATSWLGTPPDAECSPCLSGLPSVDMSRDSRRGHQLSCSQTLKGTQKYGHKTNDMTKTRA